MAAYVIRTSDRHFFKRCRTLWDFTSKIRQNWEPDLAPRPLEFGTAIHKALEVYYDPRGWHLDHEVRLAFAQKEFGDLNKEQKKKVIRVNGMDYEAEKDFEAEAELGRGMLQYYDFFAQKHDNFTPVNVEVEFEVPIPVPDDVVSLFPKGKGFLQTQDGYLTFNDELVVYQGRIDLLVRDTDGRLWIVDHKTKKQAADSNWLALDDQCGSYFWALHMMDLHPVGVIYNELFKKVPHPPHLNKNGSLSVNKQQDTTLELFVEECRKLGHHHSQYQNYIDYLRQNPKAYVRRSWVRRNTGELEIQNRRVLLEAIDMLSDPSIYPNPTQFNCNGCQFFAPCIASNEGSDVEMILNGNYRKRPNDDNRGAVLVSGDTQGSET